MAAQKAFMHDLTERLVRDALGQGATLRSGDTRKSNVLTADIRKIKVARIQ